MLPGVALLQILVADVQIVDVLHLEGHMVQAGALMQAEHHDVVVDVIVARVDTIETRQ